jgi:hypothetical protein
MFHFLVGKTYQFSIRYAVYTIPFLLIIGSYGFIEIFRQDCIKTPAKNLIAGLAFLVIFIINIIQIFEYYEIEKTDYRGAATYLKKMMTDSDILIFESYRDHGRWEPHLYGKGIYYDKLNQFSIKRATENIRNASDNKGKVFILLHEDIPRHKNLIIDDRFMEVKYKGLRIISLKQSSGQLKMDFIELITQLLQHYPQTNSRYDLYMALANTYGETDQYSSELYRTKAMQYNIPFNSGWK